MKLLVCGGRDYFNVARVQHILHAVHQRRPITLLIEGGATGADRLAREWAKQNGIPCETEVADWKRYGPAAGPIRNGLMLTKWTPDGVVAFPGGKGTRDMIEQAKAAGVKVMEVRP